MYVIKNGNKVPISIHEFDSNRQKNKKNKIITKPSNMVYLIPIIIITVIEIALLIHYINLIKSKRVRYDLHFLNNKNMILTLLIVLLILWIGLISSYIYMCCK